MEKEDMEVVQKLTDALQYPNHHNYYYNKGCKNPIKKYKQKEEEKRMIKNNINNHVLIKKQEAEVSKVRIHKLNYYKQQIQQLNSLLTTSPCMTGEQYKLPCSPRLAPCPCPLERNNQQYLKYSLLSHLPHCHFINQYYQHSTYHTVQAVPRVGRCMLQVNLCVNRQQYRMYHSYLFQVKLYVLNSRTRSYAMVFNSYDVQQLLSIHWQVSQVQLIQQIFTLFLSNMVVIKHNIYRKLMIAINTQSNNNQQQSLNNNQQQSLSNNQQQLSNNNQQQQLNNNNQQQQLNNNNQQQLSNNNKQQQQQQDNKVQLYAMNLKYLYYEKQNQKRFLKPHPNSFRVILHKVILSNNIYLLLTVKQNILIHCWVISIYCQRSGRTFCCTIHQQDLLDFQREFTSSCIPYKVVKNLQLIYHNSQQVPSYLQFHQVFYSLKHKTNQIHNQQCDIFVSNIQQKQELSNIQQKQGLFSIQQKQELSSIQQKLDATQLMRQDLDQTSQQYEYFMEMTLWDQVLDQLLIEPKRSSSNFVLKINNFTRLIRELMFEDILLANAQKLFLEMKFQENIKSQINFRINEKFGSFRYYNAINYYFNFKYINYSSQIEISQKINLRKVIYYYILHKNKPLITNNQFHSLNFQQSDLRKMSIFVFKMIKKYLKNNNLEKQQQLEKKSKIFIKKEVFCLEEEQKEKKEKEKKKNSKKIYQAVFLNRCRVLLILFYNFQAQEFTLKLYNSRNGNQIQKVIRLQQLEHKILNIEQLLAARLYMQLGSRIQTIFYNQLLQLINTL